MKRQQKYFNLETYDYTPYARELTEEEMYLVNGGKRIENSNAAVANAQVGDTLVRDDNTVVTITQGDINWAQAHTGTGSTSGSSSEDVQASSGQTENSSSSQTSQTSGTSTQTVHSHYNSSSSTSNSSSSSSSSQSSQTQHNTNDQYAMAQKDYDEHYGKNSSETTTDNSTGTNSVSFDSYESGGITVPDFNDPYAPQPDGNYEIDNGNMTISADINNSKDVIDAYKSYHTHSGRGYSFQITEGGEVIHTFTSEEYARNYVRTLDPSDGKITLSEPLNAVSTGSYSVRECLDKAASYTDDAAKLTKYSKAFSAVSNYTGLAAFGVDVINACNNPSFDTISDAAIDLVGLIPGGAAWSIGLSYAKYRAEKLGEDIDKIEQDYSDYKIKEMASYYLPENERIQQMLEPENMFWKMAETGVKQLFRGLVK